ncbi:hypothetical protein IQ268_16265 [Oculatella sp. LEGE 06141]|uniref:hypothetical protein n=1 Tax=Oculatella sp. LEGE 06141 TaxID=1828648 RepID=UPI00187EC8E0|nr:hypothetical protein [Oculatella sp. LEGE 06141]MBE9180126.1 hypothetical protein [Oculatella sp. LEGE 06141]
MQSKILLSLIAIPTLAGSMITLALLPGLASAAEAMRASIQASALTTDSASCVPIPARMETSGFRHSDPGILIASSTDGLSEYPILDFSAAESDAAATLFGCDCPACINSLRQLRTQPVNNSGEGHCWSSLLRRQISPQQIQEALQLLDAEEAN